MGFSLSLPHGRTISAPITRTDFAPVNDVKRAKRAWARASVKYDQAHDLSLKPMHVPNPVEIDDPRPRWVRVRDGFFPLRSEDH